MAEEEGNNRFHDPVLVAEVLKVLEGASQGMILDGTLGGGGHTEAMLSCWPQCRVLGVDRDPDAIERARLRPNSGWVVQVNELPPAPLFGVGSDPTTRR